ncbi:Ig-like domain-containing protein [uncultured Barnesiella sp.]|uniref:Ig-like domain-containing protein n=1 Tax=uncultured Barnesiella sp. TaxID=584861 RepID=UPI0026101EDA|nr:Ig-like domain-containing protein [uncultured Barnesiella sp.]
MKKNYFFRTAILLIAMLCGVNAGWADTYTKISTLDELTDGKYVIAYGTTCAMNNTNAGKYFNPTDITPVDGSILNPDASIVWEIKTTETGSTISNGDIFVYCSGEKNVPAKAWADGDNKFYWTFTESDGEFIAKSVGSSTALYLKYNPSSPRFTTYKSGQQDLTLYKLEESGKSNPNLAFTGITGDVTKQLSEGSYSSVATTASDATITYSSSNQEVATIAQNGLVTLVAGGTTTIKAEVAETATYEASFVEYTLTVVDPAMIKTFAKVTSGAVTDGKYIIVYQDSDDATSVKAMNTTNEKSYFMYTDVDLTDGKIVTDDQSIIWDITTQANGSMSISNGDNIFVGYRGSGNNAYIYEAYTEENCDWTFTFADGLFTCANGSVTNRLLQYNTNSPRFACYTGSQKNLTLYKLDEGKQSVTVAFNEVSGDKEVFFTESFTYNSAATATPERPITYSSSNQEVATISTEGIVTVVGPGTTIIKATTEGNDTYEEGAAQYTLTVRASSVTLPYSTDFKSGLGEWLTYVTYGTTEWGSTSYGAQANGFNKGDGETYLVSPAVSASSIVLSFGSEVAFNGPDAQLFYSSNFDPSTMTQPAEATWTEITDMATWASSQETTPSGDIELKNLTAPIRFAFKYTCSEAEGAARWTITDLSIKEGVASGIEDVEANGMKIINGKGQVTIETAEAAHVAIYALTGAQVRQLNLTEGTNIVELPAGIYVIGRQKVVVF